MLRFQFDNIEELQKLHYEAVLDYVKSLPAETQNKLYRNIIQLSGFEGYLADRDAADYGWLRQFILADLTTLRVWVAGEADKLKFMDFHDLYRNTLCLNFFTPSASEYCIQLYKL